MKLVRKWTEAKVMSSVTTAGLQPNKIPGRMMLNVVYSPVPGGRLEAWPKVRPHDPDMTGKYIEHTRHNTQTWQTVTRQSGPKPYIRKTKQHIPMTRPVTC